MPHLDLAIYAVHLGFWSSIGVTRGILRALERRQPEASPTGQVAQQATTAAFSRVLLAGHMVAFGAMYWGIGQAVIPNRVPEWFQGQRLAGTLVIALGAALMAWALVHFRSWRYRAQLDPGHELATGGPFGLMRHPLYMGLNLLALGTAVWVPTPITWGGFVLMCIGSDLRARTEEKLLSGTFGASYTSYLARTRRFIPGIY